MYLTNYLMNWADWLNICVLRVMDIHWSYQYLLFWTGIVWHRLSANQIVRCFKLKKCKNCMRYQVDVLLPLKLQKISYYFGLCQKILLANQFAWFFTFDLFDLLILIPGVHCYIVLVSTWFYLHNFNYDDFINSYNEKHIVSKVFLKLDLELMYFYLPFWHLCWLKLWDILVIIKYKTCS